MPKSVITEDEQELPTDMDSHSGKCESSFSDHTVPHPATRAITSSFDDTVEDHMTFIDRLKNKIEDYISNIAAEADSEIKTNLLREFTSFLANHPDHIRSEMVFKIFLTMSDRMLFLRELDPEFLQSRLSLVELNAFLTSLPTNDALVFLLCKANLNLDLEQIEIGNIARIISSDGISALKALLIKKKNCLVISIDRSIPVTRLSPTSLLYDNPFVRDLSSLYPQCAKSLALIPDPVSKILYMLHLLPDPKIETVEAFGFEVVMHTKEYFIKSLTSTDLAMIENLFEFSLIIQMFPLNFRLNIINYLLSVDTIFVAKINNFEDLEKILYLLPSHQRIDLLQELKCLLNLKPENIREIGKLFNIIPDNAWHDLNPLYSTCFDNKISDVTILVEIIHNILKPPLDLPVAPPLPRLCKFINTIDKKNIYKIINSPAHLQDLYSLCDNVEQAVILTQALDSITYRGWGIWTIIRNKKDLLSWLHACKFDKYIFVAKLGLPALNLLINKLEDLLHEFHAFRVINLDNIKEFTEMLFAKNKLQSFINGNLLNFHQLIYALPPAAKPLFFAAIPQEYIVALFSSAISATPSSDPVLTLPVTDMDSDIDKIDEEKTREIYERLLLSPSADAPEDDASPPSLTQTVYGLPITAKAAGFKAVKLPEVDIPPEPPVKSLSVLSVFSFCAKAAVPTLKHMGELTIQHRTEVARCILAYRNPVAATVEAAAEKIVPLVCRGIRRYYGI